MRISTFIERLQKTLETYGDLDIYSYVGETDDCHDPTVDKESLLREPFTYTTGQPGVTIRFPEEDEILDEDPRIFPAAVIL